MINKINIYGSSNARLLSRMFDFLISKIKDNLVSKKVVVFVDNTPSKRYMREFEEYGIDYIVTYSDDEDRTLKGYNGVDVDLSDYNTILIHRLGVGNTDILEKFEFVDDKNYYIFKHPAEVSNIPLDKDLYTFFKIYENKGMKVLHKKDSNIIEIDGEDFKKILNREITIQNLLED